MAEQVEEKTLDEQLGRRVRELCQQGYSHFDDGDFKTAIRRFYEAWMLLPKPQSEWQESCWVLTALGDGYCAKGDFNLGREALESALHCPGGENNPVIHFRLAQCLQGLGETALAKRHQQTVVEIGGESLLQELRTRYQPGGAPGASRRHSEEEA